MSMGVIYEPTTFTPRQANGFHAADVGRLIRMLKTLYVANPYGFSAQQKAGPLVALVDALTGAHSRFPGAVQCVGKDGL